jgi:hypothetical protein
MRTSRVSLILGSVGFVGIYVGTLVPPSYSHVGIGFQEGWGIGLLGVLVVGVCASPYVFYARWVHRRRSVVIGAAVAMYVATAVIFNIVWHDENSTAALGLYWFPFVLYPLALLGMALDRLPAPSQPPPFSGNPQW